MSIEFSGQSLNYNANHLGNRNTRSIKKEEISSTGNQSVPDLAEAIRLYRNSVLTGVRELSSEEKEEIKGLIKEYLEEHNFLEKYGSGNASSEDYAALNQFIKGLFQKFGSKGDFYEFITGFVEGLMKNAEDPNNPPHPPFKVETPPGHALTSMTRKPMLTYFQSISPHQLLMGCDISDKA